MKKHAMTLLLILVLLSSTCFANNITATTKSIYIGPVAISLGQDMTSSKKDLRRHYELKPVPSTDPDTERFVITTKKAPYDIAGSIDYYQGKVTGVSKNWGNFTDIDQANTLLNAIENMTLSSNPAIVCVSTEKHSSPGLTITKLIFEFPERKLIMAVIEVKENDTTIKQVSIDEMM